MSIQAAQIAVTSASAVELTSRDADGGSIAIKPAADIRIGGSGVTAVDGFLVEAGTTFTYDYGPGDNLFAITASGSTTVSVLRGGL